MQHSSSPSSPRFQAHKRLNSRALFVVFAWGIRLVVLGWLLSLIAPITHRAPLGPPQTVVTNQAQVCVHTDLKDEVDEWKIQRSLVMVREMGATTLVEFFPWAYFERAPGQFDWSQADRIVRHAENQGIRIIARLGLVPGWARPPDSAANALPDESFGAFADFAVAFASRYRGSIDHIIVWNEPNLAFEWGFGDFSPERYVRLLAMVSPALRAANPDVTILAGALAPTLEPPGSPNALNDLLYLEAMYEAGAAPYFDALAVHTYGFEQPPQAPPAPDALNFRRVELLREIMLRHDDEQTPVYITESGWNDDPRWNRAVRPSQRVAYTLDAFTWAETNNDWLRNLCIWILRYPRPTYRYPDGFTLITPEFQRKPLYFALQAYALGESMENELWLPPPSG